MRSLCRRLSSRRGETLVETLASILIVAVSAAIFAGMIMSSSRLNTVAKEADDAFYAELSAAETQAATTSGTVSVTWSTGSEAFAVTIAGTSGELRGYTDAGGGG